MLRISKYLVIFLFFALFLGTATWANTSKFTGDLPSVLANAGPDELIPVSIIFSDQLTGERLRSLASDSLDPDTRRRVLIRALKLHARKHQADLLQTLNGAKLKGKVSNIQPLWIGNIVAVEATADLIEQIALRPEIDRINWAPKVDVFLERNSPPKNFDLNGGFGSASDPQPDAVECGTELMQAPRVWDELGNTGEGAVIAVIDSGVCWTHPDIANQIWVNPGEDLDGDGEVMDPDDANGVDDDGNGYIDDFIGYDIDNNDNDPDDDNSHGSHVAGTVAGDGTSGTQAGMAPDAKIMVLRVGLSFSDEPDVWEAMQYAADNGADSISMSLGWPHSNNPDRATWRANADNTIDLGTAMVIAAGNEGSGNEPDNVRTPGDVPRIISVGATDCSDNIASFSSRGPVSWENVDPYFDHPYPPGLIKPDVSAPGVNTQSHSFCSGYSSKSGTSMATPHVAGAVALMKAANPGLFHDDLKQILEDTSIDLGTAGKDNVYGSGRVDAYEAVLASQTSDGNINIREAEVRCDGGLFNLVVSDQDLVSTGTLNIEITSSTEPTPEIVTLTETSASSGVFKGTIQTATGTAVNGDGILQVSNGDLVTATYIDADDGEGGINVTKTDTASTDCSFPNISDIEATDQTTSSATIRWTTDEPSSSRVTYGELKPPTIVEESAVLVTNHAVALTGLQSCTIYWYQVESADEYGNNAVANNAGSYYFFETWGDFGNGPQPCHAGEIKVDTSVLACDSVLGIELSDIDLNLSPTEIETVDVTVSSSVETTPETVTLTETGANTSTFTGSVNTSGGALVLGDGIVQTSHGSTLTATYRDQDNGVGQAIDSYATATSDCAEDGMVSIRVEDFTDESATIRVETEEPTTIVVNYGETASLGSQASSNTLGTVHLLDISLFPECGRFYFDVESTDAYGNMNQFDANGVPFEGNVGEIPGHIFKDEFDSNLGWSLDDDWEIGDPQGLGSSPGDPTSAYVGSSVLGQDLSGQGAYPGDYEPGGNNILYATSPVIDASALTSGELQFRRWLNVGGGAISSIDAFDGSSWSTIWNSDSVFGLSDSGWSLQTLDVSAYADGNSSFRIRFKQASGLSTSANRAGWNVDRFIIRDGNAPDYAACAGCGGEPSFAGVNTATDVEPCGAGGVSLSWHEAASWGTGASGTYSVYRDTSPGFTPGPGNLVASGINALSYTDTTAPDDQSLHYIVRAESDETCGSGPNNGGSMDPNSSDLMVVTSSTQNIPQDVVPILFDKVNHTHIRIHWDPVVDASSYRIYRSSSATSGFTLIDETDQLSWEDLNQAGDANDWYYQVRPINSCGQEP